MRTSWPWTWSQSSRSIRRCGKQTSATSSTSPARDAYRRRLRELDDDITEAADWNDTGRLKQLTAEREALLSELARATGLAGTPRTSGATSERARTAVRKAIVAAVTRIEQVDSSMSKHLRDYVRTGYHCRYDPAPERRMEWVLD